MAVRWKEQLGIGYNTGTTSKYSDAQSSALALLMRCDACLFLQLSFTCMSKARKAFAARTSWKDSKL